MLRLYIGPLEGGLGRSSVGVPTEKVRRPLGLTVLDRFPSLGRHNGRSQQPRLEVVPKHRVRNNTNLDKTQASCPGFPWNSQRGVWEHVKERTKRGSIEVGFSKMH